MSPIEQHLEPEEKILWQNTTQTTRLWRWITLAEAILLPVFAYRWIYPLWHPTDGAHFIGTMNVLFITFVAVLGVGIFEIFLLIRLASPSQIPHIALTPTRLLFVSPKGKLEREIGLGDIKNVEKWGAGRLRLLVDGKELLIQDGNVKDLARLLEEVR